MTRCRGSKRSSREGSGRLPSRSGAYPFVPPSTLSICAKHTRKNDKLSHLTLPRPPLPQEDRYAGGQYDGRPVIGIHHELQEG